MKKALLVIAIVVLIVVVLKEMLFVSIKKNVEQLAEVQKQQQNQPSSKLKNKTDQTSVPPPVLEGAVVSRPEFHYGQDEVQTTGTVFFLRDKKGVRYLITAAHLYKKDEWGSMRKIMLADMLKHQLGECKEKPVFLGKFTEDSEASKAILPDMSEDLAILRVPDDLSFKTLRLATQLPAKDETIWVVGCELESNQGQQLYPCRFLNNSAKLMTFKPLTKFEPDDFSGAPLVNKSGEVIGTMNGGNPNFYMGTPLSAIRKHGAEYKIEFE